MPNIRVTDKGAQLVKLYIRPATLKQLNEGVALLHRHHKPVQGHRFSLLLIDDTGVIHGGCSVGRPVARGCDPWLTAEVTRLVTTGVANGCSMLYSAAARACAAMGFTKIQTYILDTETGTSLLACGWIHTITSPGGNWNSSKFKNRRTDQPQGPKKRFEKRLCQSSRSGAPR